jgi:FMN phosphatase YigB (HAD superfamily)
MAYVFDLYGTLFDLRRRTRLAYSWQRDSGAPIEER